MKVRCIEGAYPNLTEGKIYEALEFERGSVILENDNRNDGKQRWFADRFEEVKGMTKDDLKTGMVVEVEYGRRNGNEIYLILEIEGNVIGMNINGNTWANKLGELGNEIIKIWKPNLGAFGDTKGKLRDSNLIWERETKTPNQLKLEELEKTIDEAKRQIEELKGV